MKPLKPLKPITVIAWACVMLGCLSFALMVVFTAMAYQQGHSITQHLIVDAITVVLIYLCALIVDKSEE